MRPALRRTALGAVLLGVVWLATGVRRVPPASFGVLDGLALAGREVRIESGLALAPAGIARLATYPREAVEVPLPGAEELGARGSDGAAFGLAGTAVVTPIADRWRELHEAAGGAGIVGVVTAAARASAGALDAGAGRESITVTARRRFAERLTQELAARGASLGELRLERIAYLVSDAAGTDTGVRLLVLALDGADWEILDPLFEQGRLPHLRGIVERGARARLLSISPLLSPVVWTTVATGVEPTRHGILDFLVTDAAGSSQPVTSTARRVPTVWEILSRAGHDVGVVGWWASWPADPVRGYLVSDRIAFQLFGYRADPADARGKTWPPELYERIRDRIVEPAAIGWETVERYLTGERRQERDFDAAEREILDEFRTLLAAGETTLAIAERLRAEMPTRVEAVYFEGTDTVGHLFMPYRPPPLPRIDPARMRSFSEVVDRYYETVDGYIGRLLAGRSEWTVLVVSDHGFATDATRPQATDSRVGHGAAADWHRRFGVLALAGGPVRAGARIAEASVYDVAPTILALLGEPIPRSWPGKVLAEALEPGFLAEHPVRFRADDPARERSSAALARDPAAADLIAKLEALGYVGSTTGTEPAGGETSLTTRNNVGVSLLAEGRYADAERELRAAVEEGGDRMPMLLVNLGLALRLQGRHAEAEPLFRRAIDAPATRRMGANQLALLLLHQGDSAGAEEVVRQALREEPAAGELHNTLGLVLEATGALDLAADEYGLAVEADPDSALPRNNLGNLAKGRGELAEAEQWYRQAIEADPYFMGSYNNLALVYQERGHIERAIDLYDRALARAPESGVVLNNLGSLYFATGQGERARESWEAAAGADPSYPSPLNNLGGLALTEGRIDEAEAWIQRALALDPNYGDARINLSLVLRARGSLAAARAELRRAGADLRTGGRAFKQLGLLELHEGQLDAAAAALRTACERAPRDRDAWAALGEAERRRGHASEAIAAWRRSLALDPEQPAVRAALAALEGAPGVR
jgi:Tfp pilus assembly protein PilF/predicted AlkP superfamily phosphohydrolase/phosphomutase